MRCTERSVLVLYLGIPDWWRYYKPYQVLEVPMGAMFANLGRDFFDGRGPSLSTIRGHLHRVACADYCVIGLMAFIACAFLSRELAIQNLPVHDARMQVGYVEVFCFHCLRICAILSAIARCKNWLKGCDVISCCLCWPKNTRRSWTGLLTVVWVCTIMSFRVSLSKVCHHIDDTDESFKSTTLLVRQVLRLEQWKRLSRT